MRGTLNFGHVFQISLTSEHEQVLVEFRSVSSDGSERKKKEKDATAVKHKSDADYVGWPKWPKWKIRQIKINKNNSLGHVNYLKTRACVNAGMFISLRFIAL